MNDGTLGEENRRWGRRRLLGEQVHGKLLGGKVSKAYWISPFLQSQTLKYIFYYYKFFTFQNSSSDNLNYQDRDSNLIIKERDHCSSQLSNQ